MTYTDELHDAIIELAKLEGAKKRNGTKIYYAKRRIARINAKEQAKIERKNLPRTRSPRKRQQTEHRVGAGQNRAYVLSCESNDLIQAMLALEGLRKG